MQLVQVLVPVWPKVPAGHARTHWLLVRKRPVLQLVQVVAVPVQVAQVLLQAVQTPPLRYWLAAQPLLQVPPLSVKPAAQVVQVEPLEHASQFSGHGVQVPPLATVPAGHVA